jgi:hypothetical protein
MFSESYSRTLFSMNGLGDLETKFRKEQMEVEGERVIRDYYEKGKGEMALALRRGGAGIREWEELARARDHLDIQELGMELERKEREDGMFRKVKHEDELYCERQRLVDLLFGMERNFSMMARSSLFMALNLAGLYPMTYARQHLQQGGKRGKEVVMSSEVLVWLPGVEGSKMVVGRMKHGQSEARDEWLQSLWRVVGDMNRQEVEDWMMDKVHFMAKWYQTEELVRGAKVDWKLMKFGVPRYILEKEDAGCLGIDGEDWVVFEKHRIVKSETRKIKEKNLIEKKEGSRKFIMDLLGWERRGAWMQEVWVITKNTWDIMEGLPVQRMRECLSLANWVAVDIEGGGTTLQLSMFSSRGIASFVITAGFLPDELRDLVWEQCPVILGNKGELAKYLGGVPGCVQLDPLVVLRDLPRLGTEGGLKGVAKNVLGVNIDRLKDLAGLHKDHEFELMTDKELVWGKVRVSDWTRERITTEQCYYACLDTEIIIRSMSVAMKMELRMRSFDMVPEVITFDSFMGWWDWAVDQRVNSSLLQKVGASNNDLRMNPNKRVSDTSNHWLKHSRGRRFSVACDEGLVESRVEMAERGLRSRRGAMGGMRTQEWLRKDKGRQWEISKRNRMKKVNL